jgi:hypothetical protein
MRAITYARLGDPSALELVERPIPEPGERELLNRVLESGVNPTDWKSRGGEFGGAPTEATVPNHDGAGMIDAAGLRVNGFSAGDRVWVTLAGDGRPAVGAAQEYTPSPPNAPSHSRPVRTSRSGPTTVSGNAKAALATAAGAHDVVNDTEADAADSHAAAPAGDRALVAAVLAVDEPLEDRVVFLERARQA